MEYRAEIQKIRSQYLQGSMTFEEAENRVNTLLQVMNRKGEKIAKKFGKNYKKLTFSYVFR